MITIIMGKSASGKDTLQQSMIKKGYKPIITYTTRPKRDGEIDGKEYNFISVPAFKSLEDDGFFCETRSYNTLVGGKADTWYYGSPKVNPKKNYVVILDTDGAECYADYYGTENISVIYLDVSDEEREKRASARGSFDEIEWKRRKADDSERFNAEKLAAIKELIPSFTIRKNEKLQYKVRCYTRNGDLEHEEYADTLEGAKIIRTNWGLHIGLEPEPSFDDFPKYPTIWQKVNDKYIRVAGY